MNERVQKDQMQESGSRKYFSRQLRQYRHGRENRCQRSLSYDSNQQQNPNFHSDTVVNFRRSDINKAIYVASGKYTESFSGLNCVAKKEEEEEEKIRFPGSRQADYGMSPGYIPMLCSRGSNTLSSSSEKTWNHSRLPKKVEQSGKVPEKNPILSEQWNDKWYRRDLTSLSSPPSNLGRWTKENRKSGLTEGVKNSENSSASKRRINFRNKQIINKNEGDHRKYKYYSPRSEFSETIIPIHPNPYWDNFQEKTFQNDTIDGVAHHSFHNVYVPEQYYGIKTNVYRRKRDQPTEKDLSAPIESFCKLSTSESYLGQQEESGVTDLVSNNRWRRKIDGWSNEMEKNRSWEGTQETESTKIIQEDNSIKEENQENQTKIIIMGVGTANSSAQTVHQPDSEDILKNRTCVLTQPSIPKEMCRATKQGSLLLRTAHERASSHSEASDSYRTSSDEEGNQEMCGRRRPWSHIYGDVEAERIFDPPSARDTAPSFWRRMSISGGSQPTLIAEEPPSTEVSPGLLSRYFTLRTSTPQLSSVDGVLQRFRKSFNFRFQKSKNKQTDNVATDISKNQECIASCDSHQDYVCRDINSTSGSKKSPKKCGGGANKENAKVGFRIGSLMLKSSKEGKKNKKQNEEISNEIDDFDSESKVVFHKNCHPTQKELSLSPIVIKEECDTTEPAIDIDEMDSILPDVGKVLKKNELRQNYGLEQPIALLTPHNTPTTEQASLPSPINLCALHLQLLLHHYRGIARLRRSISQPIALETIGSIYKQGTVLYGLSEQESQEVSLSSSEEEISSDSELYHSQRSSSWRSGSSCGEYDCDPTDAEITWERNATDTEEFDVKTCDRIKMSDPSTCKEWWLDSSPNRNGWLFSAYTRLNTNREILEKEGQSRPLIHKFSTNQIRASVVQEIITTEQDYVKHLKDVVEGYLRQVQRRLDMFSEECIATIFGNIEVIYNFQSQFLKHLQNCFDTHNPHMSQIGNCFLQHKLEFKMYSEYCNNHPLAVSKLQELYVDPKYLHFFEACRLLQEMIDISLDGFLLTPIQRICKYPLQLTELLKYTSSDHPDYKPVTDALAAMQEVAHMVNERKRRMECLEQLAELQQNIEGWEGPELLDTSTILIHSGELTRVSSSWSRDLYVFLFDHLLIYCKKDLLKRNIYVYKGRLNLNSCQLVEVEDGRDVHFNVTVRNAWKLYCSPRKKWFLFYTKSPTEKSKWIQAFREERRIVDDDDSQGFVVTPQDKKVARAAVMNKIKPRRSRVKVYKKNAYPDVSPLHLSVAGRTGSLPSNFQPDFVAMSGRSRKLRKKESGWFHFGSGKKRKK